MSSISVYREFDCKVDEDTHISKNSLQYEAEILMREMTDKLVILRLAGLMGSDRVSGRWSKVKSFSDGYVNYIHKDDVIGVVDKIIASNIKNEVFNVVAPKHPLRSQVHQKNSKHFGFTLGTFEGMSKRIVSSSKLSRKLNYKFTYPNPLEFW